MEKSRSWSSAHDWKSCNRQKRFEGSNPSFSARKKALAAASAFFNKLYFTEGRIKCETLFLQYYCLLFKKKFDEDKIKKFFI